MIYSTVLYSSQIAPQWYKWSKTGGLFEVCLEVCGNLIYMSFQRVIIPYGQTSYKTYWNRPSTDLKQTPFLDKCRAICGVFAVVALKMDAR